MMKRITSQITSVGGSAMKSLIEQQQSDPLSNCGENFKTEVYLWVLDEPFEFGVLPLQPSSKIGISLLRKVSSYIKMKNMYPALNLSAWLHISQLKLKMGSDVPWIYLRMFDILKQQMSRNDKDLGYWDFKCEQLRKGRKDKKDEFRVPTFEFLIFLYIQNSYKMMKRLSSQITSVVRRQDDRWALKPSEPKIQNEQLHYHYVHETIEELIDFLQEGYKKTDEVSLTIIESLNLLLHCTIDGGPSSLEKIVSFSKIAQIVGYDCEKQTVNRILFIEWLRKRLILNPCGSASSFVYSMKVFPFSGAIRKESKDVSWQNRIIFNGRNPPFAWTIISNVCYQVLFHSQHSEFTNLKIHRCNNSFLYAPGIYNCVFVDKCVNSTIFLGVTAKVIKFFGCSNTKVYSVSRLVIITDCINSEFYLLTPCQPIMTGSRNDSILLAPYNTFYHNLNDHLYQANLKANVSNWNEPVQIGFDGMSLLESSSPVWNLVNPLNFENFNFPFEITGDTDENPLLIPDEYQEVVDARAKEMSDWKEQYFSKDCLMDARKESDQRIVNCFWAWLAASGLGKEVDGLVNLENVINNGSEASEPEFEFSQCPHDQSNKLNLKDLLCMTESFSDDCDGNNVTLSALVFEDTTESLVDANLLDCSY